MKPKRIESIDILRGIVMVIMALDHVRDYFHVGANIDNPLNLATTTPILFFTRWITHFCAPVFVFLSGTSIYLQSLRKTKKELSGFLLKRGLWLIAIEFIVISFAWSFNPDYDFFFLQVIWVIGISMVLLAGLIHLPFYFILATGLLIVLGHNLLDIPESAPGFSHGFLWDLLHGAFFSVYPFWKNHNFLIVYPFLPWTGVMALGYCMGRWFDPMYDGVKRSRNLTRLGIGILVFFIAVRFGNFYGDPVKWSPQKNGFYTFLSFINIHKYHYLCLAKGLTGGYLPMAATLTTQEVFDAFLGEYDEFKTFFHGHSYTGNQLGAAAGLASLELLHTKKSVLARAELQRTLDEELKTLWSLPHVGDIRQVGLIAGVELVRDWRTREPFPLHERAGLRVCEAMAKRGVLTRPIGNVIVLMPPYCTTQAQARRMVSALRESVEEVLEKPAVACQAPTASL